MDELHAREKEMQHTISGLQTEKHRLEDTIYRIKTEAMTNTMRLKQMEEKLEQERNAGVSYTVVII